MIFRERTEGVWDSLLIVALLMGVVLLIAGLLSWVAIAVRNFWFEFSGGLLLAAIGLIGLFWLLDYPEASWIWRVPFAAVDSTKEMG
jgi:hypothetical protein